MNPPRRLVARVEALEERERSAQAAPVPVEEARASLAACIEDLLERRARGEPLPASEPLQRWPSDDPRTRLAERLSRLLQSHRGAAAAATREHP
jgi:hypothetical protein